MPWKSRDVKKHTKAAKSAKAKRQWIHVASRVLKATGNEGRAVRAANAVVGGTAKHHKKMHRWPG